MKQNKKGFTLIELLAVIIILGVLLLIAVPAVSKYIENSRKSTYVNSVKSIVSAVSASVNNLEYQLPKDGEGIIVPFSKVELEKGNANVKSPYAKYVDGKSYVVVVYNDGGYLYYVATLDESGFAIPMIESKKLTTSSITTDANVIDKNIHSIEEIKKYENGNYKTFGTDAFAYTYKSESSSIVKVDVMLGLSGAILRDNLADSDTGIDFNAISSDTNGKGLYYTSTNTENNLRTYYFRGDVKNNYVKFGKDIDGNDLYWRIVRINEDGSIRLIYQGTSATGNGQIGTSAFNESYNDNAYVGYMYGAPEQSGDNAYTLTHDNTNNSIIKTFIDNWYSTKTNLSTYLSTHLADSGFCNDRSLSSGTGIGKSETNYGAYNRLSTNKTPHFACPNASNDLFTTSSSTKGNKALTNPIGLITADEVVYAGGKYDTDNSSYYLHAGKAYWTMSPYRFGGIYANMWTLYSNTKLKNEHVRLGDYAGVRPVINLKSSVEIISGDGTSNNPYVIKTN